MSEKNWITLEKESTSYIENIININNVIVSLDGYTNSTTNDINIFCNNKLLTSIEVKSHISQGGQIATLIKDGEFILSPKYKGENSLEIEQIINHINQNITTYKNVSTKGIPINMDTSIFYKHLINYYKEVKICDFIITKSPHSNQFILFNIKELPEYFDISCCLRRKKSGTRHVSKKNINHVLQVMYDKFEYKKIINHTFNNKKYFISFKSPIADEDLYINSNDQSFYLSLVKEPNNQSDIYTYNIKTLSKTNNPNIMFTIKLKNTNHKKLNTDKLKELIINKIKD